MMGEVANASSVGERASEAALRARWLETRDRTHYDGCALQDARCALAVVFALLDTTRADLATAREENAQLKRIRTLLIRALVHASGAPEDAVRDAPMGVANAVARRLTAAEAERDALRDERDALLRARAQ